MSNQPLPQSVHLVGIGGIHVSAIARILLTWGHRVSGSDLRRSPVTDAVESLGATVFIGHAAENVGDVDLVVTTSAASADNPEINEARRRGIAVIKRAEMVARLMEGKVSVCVAGSHGKSTTSGMVAYILARAGYDPTYLIGAEVPGLGTNAAPGAGAHVVVEADEYDRAFLSYSPNVALVLNVEPDHLDYYGTVDAMVEAFEGFAARVVSEGTLIVCADNPGALALREHAALGVYIETYSLELDRGHDTVDAGWKGRILDAGDGGSQRFAVLRYGETFGEFTTLLPGEHMVSNAIGAIAVCAALGLTAGEIAGPLSEYGGVHRRFELVGEAAGVRVMDDYAHHPTEVESLAAAARQRFPGRRLVALFQPHTYARTRYLLEGWRACFHGFDRLFLLETYAAREAIADGMTAEQLSHEVQSPAPVYCATPEGAADAVAAGLMPGDVFFTVGAGDVDAVGPMVLERLRNREAAAGGRA